MGGAAYRRFEGDTGRWSLEGIDWTGGDAILFYFWGLVGAS